MIEVKSDTPNVFKGQTFIEGVDESVIEEQKQKNNRIMLMAAGIGILLIMLIYKNGH